VLRALSIRDYVIVERLDLELAAGFTALTGETGAGKSILLDALMLALGERADPGVVRAGSERAEVSADFDALSIAGVREWLASQDFDEGDGACIVRRTIDAAGRSRGFVNGRPATAAQLRELGEMLVDIHGQHDHQLLLKRDRQRMLLDAYGGCEGLARVDFFVDGEQVLVNELNTMPGFTPTSVYAKLMDASGIAYPELLDRLCRLAMERHEQRRGRA